MYLVLNWALQWGDSMKMRAWMLKFQWYQRILNLIYILSRCLSDIFFKGRIFLSDIKSILAYCLYFKKCLKISKYQKWIINSNFRQLQTGFPIQESRVQNCWVTSRWTRCLILEFSLIKRIWINLSIVKKWSVKCSWILRSCSFCPCSESRAGSCWGPGKFDFYWSKDHRLAYLFFFT